MRSPSLERLHAKLSRQIKLVESYTELAGMEFIIKACRLKPYDYVFKGRDSKLILHRWWFDEFGNSLMIDKKVKIIYNDLLLDRKLIISTDLYYGLSLDRVAKMSKLVHLVGGKDEDLYQDCYLLTFLGIDDHLRSYLYWIKMKIPTDKDVNADWESAWYIAAANVTMETGVFVEVRKDYGKYPGTSGYPASANFS